MGGHSSVRVLGVGVGMVLLLSVLAVAPAWAEQRVTFSTSDHTFRTGDEASQGWYGNRTGSTNNDNYLVGKGGQTYRNFFTFDLRSLTGTIIHAKLRIRRGTASIGPVETLALFDVETRARPLNRPQGDRSRAIYHDLGTGRRYGSYELRTSGRSWNVLVLRLNQRAIEDIDAAEGRFFSIGGRLLSISDRGNLFGHTDARGPQELVIRTATEDRSLTFDRKWRRTGSLASANPYTPP